MEDPYGARRSRAPHRALGVDAPRLGWDTPLVTRWLLVEAPILLAAACGGSVVAAGPGDGGGDASHDGTAGGESGGPSDGAPTGDGTGADASSPLPLSGTYVGYIESFSFPDGSDAVSMTLVFAGDGTVTGSITFGDGPPLPPPTDPDVGYPPGLVTTPGMALPFEPPVEGFAFTALQASYAAPRVRAQLDPREVWKQWCQLQTTIYPQYNGDSDGGCGALEGYGCLPNAGFGGLEDAGPDGGCGWYSCQQPWTPIDCGKEALCLPNGSPCTCTATSCTVVVGTTGAVSFDMQLASGHLDGSVTGIEASQVLNVHLTRQ